jgi:hypothetical protein
LTEKKTDNTPEGAKVFLGKVTKDVAKRLGKGVSVELGLQYIASKSSTGLAGIAIFVYISVFLYSGFRSNKVNQNKRKETKLNKDQQKQHKNNTCIY